MNFSADDVGQGSNAAPLALRRMAILTDTDATAAERPLHVQDFGTNVALDLFAAVELNLFLCLQRSSGHAFLPGRAVVEFPRLPLTSKKRKLQASHPPSNWRGTYAILSQTAPAIVPIRPPGSWFDELTGISRRHKLRKRRSTRLLAAHSQGRLLRCLPCTCTADAEHCRAENYEFL
jgi:hypothetical protein